MNIPSESVLSFASVSLIIANVSEFVNMPTVFQFIYINFIDS